MVKTKPKIDTSDRERDLNLVLSESESDDDYMIIDDYDVNDNMKMSQARQKAESKEGRRVGGRNGAGTNQASSPQHSTSQSGSQKVGRKYHVSISIVHHQKPLPSLLQFHHYL